MNRHSDTVLPRFMKFNIKVINQNLNLSLMLKIAFIVKLVISKNLHKILIGLLRKAAVGQIMQICNLFNR